VSPVSPPESPELVDPSESDPGVIVPAVLGAVAGLQKAVITRLPDASRTYAPLESITYSADPVPMVLANDTANAVFRRVFIKTSRVSLAAASSAVIARHPANVLHFIACDHPCRLSHRVHFVVPILGIVFSGLDFVGSFDGFL
jgi:hypothetical protein